jgi:hypothetical protein
MIDKEKTDALRQRLQELKGDGDKSKSQSIFTVIVVAIAGLIMAAAKIYLFYYVQEVLLTRAGITPLSLKDAFIFYVFVATLIPWSKLWKRKND